MPDAYGTPVYLADQTSAGAVLTFAFPSSVQKVWVELLAIAVDDISTARVRVDGSDPAADTGVVIHAGAAHPFAVWAKTVKVLAAAGKVIAVHGYRDATP